MIQIKITINTDATHVAEIRENIKANDGHCPCQLVKDETTKCICKKFMDSKESGWCICGLYHKEMEKGD